MKTVRELIDELDGYGDSVPVVIEDRSGRHYELAVDDTHPRGVVHVVLVAIGSSVDLNESDDEG